MRKMRAAVIGCGRISTVYREAFERLDDVLEVVFAADKLGERAEAFASHFPGCRWTEETEPDKLEQELKQVEADTVHILLPHHLHQTYANMALACGCHVLTEKPIALTTKAADSMIRTARENGKKLGVIFQNRYIPGIQRAKKLLEAGELGRVTGAFSNLNWHRPPSYYDCDWKGFWATEGGGVVIDQAIHSIDLVRYLIGEEAVEVDGHYSCRILHKSAPQVEVEDEADGAITFASGAVYSFFATNYYTANRPIQIELSCEKGFVHLNHQTVTIQRTYGETEVIMPGNLPKGSGESYWGDCHYQQIKEFYHCLAMGEDVPWDPEDAKKTLEIVLAIYESSRKGKAVRI